MAVVARLLSPEDFGIVAVSTAFIGLIDAFTDLGADTALIRHPNPVRKHYDTVWTLTVMVHTVSAMLIALLGFFSWLFYNDPRYEWVLYVLAISMFFNGFGNIGIADFRRNLQYHKDFQFNVLIQLFGVISTVALAVWLRSYWALILGGLARTCLKLLLSYVMHTYRPRFSLGAFAELSGFSFWIMVRSVAIFLTQKADRLILAGFFSPALLGFYAIAGELASMAVFELLHPIGRALLPALATKQHDKAWLETNIKKLFNITATLAVATGVGLAAVAEPVLTLIYGRQYTEAAPMLAVLAISSAIAGFSQPIGQFLLLLNKAREFALLLITEGIIRMAVVYFLAANHYGFDTILYALLGIQLLAFLRFFYLLKLFKSITLATLLAAWIRPVIAGALMFLALDYCHTVWATLPPAFLLPALIGIGAAVFGAVLFSLWFLMRKPQGLEQELMSRLAKKTQLF